MKLTPELKQRIDDYFDNITNENLQKAFPGLLEEVIGQQEDYYILVEEDREYGYLMMHNNNVFLSREDAIAYHQEFNVIPKEDLYNPKDSNQRELREEPIDWRTNGSIISKGDDSQIWILKKLNLK